MNDHRFEILILVGIFVFSCFMLAFSHSEELSRWIENGAIITVIARGMAGKTTESPKPTDEAKKPE